MKVIDLLNKIANDKEVPKKIKWGVHEFEWFVYEYKAKDEFQEPTLLDYLSQTPSMLNDKVEIIEEEKKIPEKLKLYAPYPECHDTRFEDVENKINEIIDYLKSKGE